MSRSTSRSQLRRCEIRSAILAIFRPCRWANPTRSGRRAMVPSSFMISQITADGLTPASRATSTAASVWPARTSTPPSRAIRGKMWPGIDEVRPGRRGVDRDLDGARPVRRRDAGGDPLARLDADRERRREAGFVAVRHQRQAQRLDPLPGQREADQAAAVLGHEVDRRGIAVLGWDHQIALVLAALVVHQDEHAAAAGVLAESPRWC